MARGKKAAAILTGTGATGKGSAAAPPLDLEKVRSQIDTIDEKIHALINDRARLAQVFGNLLNNSCKYTKPDGAISLHAERNGNDEVLVSVRDNGAGIPSDKLDSIFDMFMQVDRSSERSQDGLGIGLTLVKRLV